ncbi:MAG: hypothetical protein HQ553_16365 [Chloroflexi bacterium]|nr:hypothetical protein [Chloroflexota bacterium]
MKIYILLLFLIVCIIASTLLTVDPVSADNATCEKGWETRGEKCVPCDDICKTRINEHYVYDPAESSANNCECKCEDGYKVHFEKDFTGMRYVTYCKKMTDEPEEENCDNYCKTTIGENAEHVIVEGDYPDCVCEECEKDWTMEEQGCVSCEDICQKEGSHYVYDPEESYTNMCFCKCENGYESDWDDSGNKICNKVECPENSQNVSDLTGSSLPSDDRKLNRDCYCEEDYITSFGTCIKKEPGTEEYYIDPGVKEITVGGKTEFSLKKKEFGRYTTISSDNIKWDVTYQKSINPRIPGKVAEIGAIDGNGEFTSKNIGTCIVTAEIDGTRVKAYVTVKCGEDVEGDLNEILRLYKNRIPKGQLWRDFDTLVNSYYDNAYARYYAHFLDNRLDDPPDAGFYNNMLSLAGYKIYDDWACGSYQAKVLEFLNNIQSNPDECTLLNNYDFGPIEGRCGRHHAVVIYPKGTDWKTEGTVLDPWPSQSPEYVPISKWGYAPVAGESQQTFREYPTYPIDSDSISTSMAELCNRMDDVQMEAMELTWKFADTIVGLVLCPLDLQITDSEGRRLGMLADGSMAYEIPLSYIWNTPAGETENYWYFELNSNTLDPYNFELTGIDDGPFELLWVSSEDKEIMYYGEQSIKKGEIVTISIDPENPNAPLILPNGSEIQPTLLKPVTDITSPSPSPTMPEGAAGLVGESRTVIPGGTVSVPVILENVEDIGSLNFNVTYDSSVINIDRVDKGSLLSGISFVVNPNETGIIRFGFATIDGVSGTGPVGYIVCDAVGSDGSYTPLTISGVEATDSSGNPVTLQTTNGSVTIDSDRIIGDSNGDGVITELDALAALRMSVNLMEEDLILDMDQDRRVTAKDALAILSIAVRGR